MMTSLGAGGGLVALATLSVSRTPLVVTEHQVPDLCGAFYLTLFSKLITIMHIRGPLLLLLIVTECNNQISVVTAEREAQLLHRLQPSARRWP